MDKPVSLWRDAWERLRRNKLAVIGLVMVLVLFFAAVFGPCLTPYDFLSQNLDDRNLPLSWAHLFGTDDLGRDVFSRVIYGARTAFLVAVVRHHHRGDHRRRRLARLPGYIGGNTRPLHHVVDRHHHVDPQPVAGRGHQHLAEATDRPAGWKRNISKR